jgi:hypothetical protein
MNKATNYRTNISVVQRRVRLSFSSSNVQCLLRFVGFNDAAKYG